MHPETSLLRLPFTNIAIGLAELRLVQSNNCELIRKEHKAELHTAYCLLVAVVKQFSSADNAASITSGYHSNIAQLSCSTVESLRRRR